MRSTSIALLAAAAGAAVAENSTDCSEGLHMIVARGTNEDAGPGSMGELADRVADRIKSSDVEGLDYPASLTDPDYVDSVSEGTSELRETIREYVKACPDSKLAVLGYSQGAQVSSDVFCGGDSSGSDDNEALSKDLVEESIVAIVLFGDPSRVANATYNEGTAEHDGIFSRNETSACEDLGDRIVSYCDAGDVYCDGGGDNRTVHGLYIDRYADDVVKFIVDRYKSDSGDGPSASGSGSPTATGDEGATTETGDAEDEASVMAPGLGLLALLSLAVLGLM